MVYFWCLWRYLLWAVVFFFAFFFMGFGFFGSFCCVVVVFLYVFVWFCWPGGWRLEFFFSFGFRLRCCVDRISVLGFMFLGSLCVLSIFGLLRALVLVF